MADGSLIFDTLLDSKGFKDGLNKMQGIAKGASVGIVKGVAAVSAAIVGMGVYSLKASIDFESAFAGVRKTVNATEKQFADLEKGIRNMSKEMPQSATAIAGVAESAGQLGIATENILDFTKTMVMLGDATNMSSEEAATALARLANITGMSQDDFDKLGSTIVALGNNLATTESEIVEMGLRLAGTASQVGMTEEQMLALAGAMSSVGINAEAGGSSMSRVMQKINSDVLSGGGNLKDFAKISGMSADEFSKAWKEKPTEALLAFVQGLDAVNANGGDVTSMLKELGINSIQEIDTILRLSGANQTLADALGISADAWAENTALANEAEQRYKTTDSMIKILKNNIDDLAISVGDGLKESMRDGIGTAIEMVQQLSSAFETGGLPALVETVGTVLADLVTKIAEYAPILLDSAVNMIQSFITGIRSNLSEITGAAIELIQSFVTAFLEIFPEVLTLGIELISTLIQGIAEMLPELIPMAVSAIDVILNALMENLPLIINSGVQILIALIQGIATALPNLITQVIDLVILVCDKLIENLPLIINAGLQLIMALAQGIIDNLPKLIENAPRIINDLANAIYSMLPAIIMTGIKIIIALIKGLIESIPTLIANIPAIIMAIVNVFTLYNWWNLGKGVITKLGEGIKGMLGSIKGTASNIANGVTEAIKGIFNGAASLGKNLITNIISGIKSLLSSIVSTARSIGSSVINAITGALSNAASIGTNLVQGIWNGISNATGWLLSKITSFGKSIEKGIKSFFGIKSPSTLFRDEIGKNLTLGIGVGLEKGMPELQSDADKELSKLTKKMKATVDFETSDAGSKISSATQIYKPSSSSVNTSNTTEDNNGNKQGTIYATFEVDGREFAKATAPYTSNELAVVTRRLRG